MVGKACLALRPAKNFALTWAFGGHLGYTTNHDHPDANYLLTTRRSKADPRGRFAPFFVSGFGKFWKENKRHAGDHAT
jgi:hypothetical protein